jgi:hypothetical protein
MGINLESGENVEKIMNNTETNLTVDIVERLRRNTVSDCMSAASEAAAEIIRLRELLNSEYKNKLNFLSVLKKYWPGTINELLEDHSRLRDALKLMTQVEPCDCGCPNALQPVLMKPHHYYIIAKEALEGKRCADEK